MKNRIKNLRKIVVNGKQYKWLLTSLDEDSSTLILKVWDENKQLLIHGPIKKPLGSRPITPKHIQMRIMDADTHRLRCPVCWYANTYEQFKFINGGTVFNSCFECPNCHSKIKASAEYIEVRKRNIEPDEPKSIVNDDLLSYYVEKMKKEQHRDDPDITHRNADRLLCELLASIGCSKLVAEYNKVLKWYA